MAVYISSSITRLHALLAIRILCLATARGSGSLRSLDLSKFGLYLLLRCLWRWHHRCCCMTVWGCILLRIFLCLLLFMICEHLYGWFISSLTLIIKLLLVCGTALPINLEAKNHWLIAQRSVLWVQIWISLEQYVRKANAEVGPINV